MQNRRTRSRITVALAVLAGGVGTSGCRRGEDVAPARPARIVLVTIDTLRADHVSFDGYFRPTTPFLDELAAEGAVFTSCISASSLTAPSHASMLTGVFPPQHGIVTNAQKLPPMHPTFVGALSEAGWQTAAFTGVRFLQQLDVGFEEFHAAPQRHDDEVPYRTAEETVDDALAWWRDARDASRPTFLWIHFFDVHEYQTNTIDPSLVRADPTSEEAFRKRLRAHLRSEMPYADQHVAVIDRYDSQILAVDRALRRLYGAVEGDSAKSGLWVITSDHGEGLGTHGFFGHGKFIYEEQLHVPLLVHDSARRRERSRVDELVRTIDLAPTIAEAAGVPFAPRPLGDPSLDARPLQPLLDGPPGAGRLAFALRRPANEARIAIGWEDGVLSAIRTRRHKLIRHTHGLDELYDLRNDPGELVNLLPTGDVEPGVRERLEAAHDAVLGAAGERAATNDSFLEELEQLGYLK